MEIDIIYSIYKQSLNKNMFLGFTGFFYGIFYKNIVQEHIMYR